MKYLQLQFDIDASLLGIVNYLFDSMQVLVLVVLESLDDASDHVDDVDEHSGNNKGDDRHVHPFSIGDRYNISESHRHRSDTHEVDRVDVLGHPIGIADTLSILPSVLASIVLLLDMSNVVEEAGTYMCHYHDHENLSG
jgi:hypothetical protein